MSSVESEGKQLLSKLSKEVQAFLERVGEEAQDQGVGAFLVGGVVRDLIRDDSLADVDIDVVIEGDAEQFAETLVRYWSRDFSEFEVPQVRAFPRYGTAKLVFKTPIFAQIEVIDFAMARSERYEEPAGIPEVAPAKLERDLGRRDFSMNAIAIELTELPDVRIIDPFSGKQDIKQGVVRILHEKSFVDDPARMIRAIRFIARFGLTFEARTAQCFDEALEEELLSLLPPKRRFDEFLKGLAEKGRVEILRAFEKNGILQQLLPALKFNSHILERLEAAGAHPILQELVARKRSLVYFAALFDEGSDEALERAYHDFGIPTRERTDIERFRAALS